MNVRINQNLLYETFVLISHHYAPLTHFEIAGRPCGYNKLSSRCYCFCLEQISYLSLTLLDRSDFQSFMGFSYQISCMNAPTSDFMNNSIHILLEK